jgi:hypothetical protein
MLSLFRLVKLMGDDDDNILGPLDELMMTFSVWLGRPG